MAAGRKGGKRSVNGRFHVVVAVSRATAAVVVKVHGQNVALYVQSDIRLPNPHIDFRQLHARCAGVTVWKNRRKDIAALFGGVVIRFVWLPRHPLNGNRLRRGFGVVCHHTLQGTFSAAFGVIHLVAGRPQRSGQVYLVQLCSGGNGLILYRLVQPVKVCDSEYLRFLRLLMVRFRQFWRRRIVLVVRLRFLAALVTDKAARLALHSLHVPAILVMFSALMGAIQFIALWCMFMGGVAVRRQLHILIVIAANQFVCVTAVCVDVFTAMALHCFHIAAFCCMFRMVFAQALRIGCRPFRINGGPQLSCQQDSAQKQRKAACMFPVPHIVSPSQSF